MIANIERGERRIDIVEFVAIARAMGVGEAELMTQIGKAIGTDLEL